MADEKKVKTTPATAKKKIEKKAVTSEKKSGLEIAVYNIDGKESKTVSLPTELFNVEASPRLLSQYVRMYLANQRQGNASTKTRGEVIGTTKKIYRQKGTGKARHGSKKAPIFVGGGIVGGPQPKDFSMKMNKKQKQKALLYSLSLKAKEGSIVGFEDAVSQMKPQTKKAVELMKALGFGSSKTLVVLPKMDKNGLILSIRNLQNVDTIIADSMNAYAVLNHQKIIFTEAAIESLKKHFIKAE